jgi:penicillin-binding protein 2
VTENRAGTRLKILVFLVLSMFAALTARLWFLQVLAAEKSKEAASNNGTRLVDVPATRGTIYDANGEVLVGSRESLVLMLNDQLVGDRREEVLFQLSKLLDEPAADLGQRLDDGLKQNYPYTPIPIATNVPKRVALYIEERGDEEFPGVSVVEQPIRTYPLGYAGAHVFGYLGQISEEELKSPAFADYDPGDVVGVAGVESVYEQYLAGTDGVDKFRVNSLGENLGQIGGQAPVPGDNVYLTIDADTQRLAEESLRLGIRDARATFDTSSNRTLKADAGAVVVMNPDTGAIEAMASYPGFQPTAFVHGMTNSQFQRRFVDTDVSPLVNRAISGQYPPGSTYKPWIALSSLATRREGGAPGDNIASLNRSYGCPPVYVTPYDTNDPNATQYPFHNWTTVNLGFMSLAKALAVSCDTVFYPMGYEYWKLFYPYAGPDGQQGTDDDVFREPLQGNLNRIGFGRLTNVDLPGEQEGRVPTAEWKRDIHAANPDAFPYGDWVPGDFINMSIGQGDTLVTPLQMASAYSGLMSADGRVCVPHVLDRIIDPNAGTLVRRYGPRCGHRLPFDAQDLAYVRQALEGTVRPGGTAGTAFAGFPFSQVDVAGKTGTAQVYNKQDFSWFASMVQSQGERHVIVVLVEQGGHGSTTSAPIARHITEGLYGIPFSEVGTVAATD